MNEEFFCHYDNVHVPPAVGDEGQSLGTYMHADYTLNNSIHVPDTYAGKEYEFDGGEPIFFFVSDFSAAGVGQCYHNYGNPAFSISSGNSDANGFGNFEYSVPSGYYALNTSNLNTYG